MARHLYVEDTDHGSLVLLVRLKENFYRRHVSYVSQVRRKFLPEACKLCELGHQLDKSNGSSKERNSLSCW